MKKRFPETIKLEMLFSLSVPLSIGETAAILATSRHMPLDKLSLIVFVKESDKIIADSFTKFSDILSTPEAFSKLKIISEVTQIILKMFA